jgi:hypothetical protein
MSFTKVKNNNLYDPDLVTLAEKGVGTGANQIVQRDGSGDIVGLVKTSDIGTNVQAFDATIVVDADIGTTVQAFDATIVVDADIGTTVQAYDATIVVDADIGVNVQAFDATIVVDADIGTTVQAYDADLTTLATNGIGTSANQIVQLNGSAELPAVSGANLTNLPGGGTGEAKCWGHIKGDGTSIQASHGISSITDVATGTVGINLATNFSTVNYAIVSGANRGGASYPLYDINVIYQSAGSYKLMCQWSSITTSPDPVHYYTCAFGDQ